MSKMSQLSASTARNIQKSFTLMSVGVAAAASLVTASLATAMVKAEDFAFNMQKTAEIVGTSSEMMSKLAYNAKLTGVPLDTLSGAMERLARTATAAQSGQKKAIETFGLLGIKVDDLRGPLSNSGDLLVAVAKRMEVYRKSTSNTGLEQALFARSGAKLAPLLQQIGTGFDAASKQAALFGVVVGDKTAAQSRELHQSMVQLESIATGLSLRLLTGVAPALKEAANRIVDFVTSANGMKMVENIAHNVSTAIHLTATAFGFLATHSTALFRTLEVLAAVRVSAMLVALAASAGTTATLMVNLNKAIKLVAGGLLGIKIDTLTKAFTTFGTTLTGIVSRGIATYTATSAAATIEAEAFATSVIKSSGVLSTSLKPAFASAAVAATEFATTVASKVTTSMAAVEASAVAVNTNNLRFVFMDAAIAAQAFGSRVMASAASSLITLRGLSLTGMFTALRSGFTSVIIVTQVLANNLMNKVRLGLLSIQSINITSSLQSMGAAFVSFGATAWGAIKGVTVALYEMTIAALTNPLGWLIVGVGAVIAGTVALYKFRDATISIGGKAYELRDTWSAAWLAIKDAFSGAVNFMGGLWTKFTGFLGSTSIGKIIEDQIGRLSSAMSAMKIPVPEGIQKYLDQAKENRLKAAADAAKANAVPDSTNPNGGRTLDAPVVTVPKTEKIDIVAKKMTELRDAAEAAHKSLMDAGKDIRFERMDEASSAAKKTIDQLNIALKNNTKLTKEQETAIEEYTKTQVFETSQGKYEDSLQKGTNAILGQTSAQEMLNAAIGQGASVVREAAIAANAAREDANADSDWLAKTTGLRSMRDKAFGKENDAKNSGSNASAIANLTIQLKEQNSLNDAILRGKDAQEAANLARQSAAIRTQYGSSGNIDNLKLTEELALNQSIFEAKKKQQDLEQIVSSSPSLIYRQQTEDLNNLVEAANKAGQALSSMRVQEMQKASWKEYTDAIDKTTLAVGNASQGVGVFFRQMSRETESAAEQVYRVLGGAFESLNSIITKTVETTARTFRQFIREIRNEFAGLFRSLAGNLAKIALQKVEKAGATAVLSKMGIADKIPGLGKKDDPVVVVVNKSNELLTKIYATLASMQANAMTNGSSTAGASGIPFLNAGDSSGSDGSVSGGGGFLNTALGIGMTAAKYGGGFALGGNVQAGTSYDVGEMGRETFTPTTNGTITPNNKLGGNTAIHIDARGANDPAQTEMAIHRAMAQYGPAIASSAIRAMHEKTQRSPMSASR